MRLTKYKIVRVFVVVIAFIPVALYIGYLVAYPDALDYINNDRAAQ